MYDFTSLAKLLVVLLPLCSLSGPPCVAANNCKCTLSGYKSVCTKNGLTLGKCKAKCYGLEIAFSGPCPKTFFYAAQKDKMDPSGSLLTPTSIRNLPNIWDAPLELLPKVEAPRKSTPARGLKPTTSVPLMATTRTEAPVITLRPLVPPGRTLPRL